jgi:hypothetical protein
MLLEMLSFFIYPNTVNKIKYMKKQFFDMNRLRFERIMTFMVLITVGKNGGRGSMFRDFTTVEGYIAFITTKNTFQRTKIFINKSKIFHV